MDEKEPDKLTLCSLYMTDESLVQITAMFERSGICIEFAREPCVDHWIQDILSLSPLTRYQNKLVRAQANVALFRRIAGIEMRNLLIPVTSKALTIEEYLTAGKYRNNELHHSSLTSLSTIRKIIKYSRNDGTQLDANPLRKAVIMSSEVTFDPRTTWFLCSVRSIKESSESELRVTWERLTEKHINSQLVSIEKIFNIRLMNLSDENYWEWIKKITDDGEIPGLHIEIIKEIRTLVASLDEKRKALNKAWMGHKQQIEKCFEDTKATIIDGSEPLSSTRKKFEEDLEHIHVDFTSTAEEIFKQDQ